jgi:hypothetical protein
LADEVHDGVALFTVPDFRSDYWLDSAKKG